MEDASASGAKHTVLYALHQELGGKIVPFAGYALPVQYPAGIMAEHKQAREAAALFDVSHMGQVKLEGADRIAALEALVPADLAGLALGRQRYSFFTNDAGGILDDLMISNQGDWLFLVVNAACKEADIAHLKANLKGDVTLTEMTDRALIALQGPKAADVLARLAPGVQTLRFMDCKPVDIDGAACLISRSGYTGEDGYEISVPAAKAEALARRLLAEDEVAPAGLGARDSLRLEAGLCLYGHDIDTTTTPVEADLTWAIQKRRKQEGGFPGAAVVQKQLAEGAGRRRVGLKPEGRAPMREGTELQDDNGQTVGSVTSGGFGPTLGGPLAMGYVKTALAAEGTPLQAMVRGKAMPCRVVALPFVPHNYFRG
ncbi:glycine cleavage system aminomethyltransferase GcvT [Pelagibius sp. 7325]|uniref:glycine cleavage system aminomethyltransferase GcvT n=1 Tax=Pelagibius sp. 7325 TaxID=3131994 RepID=UPI0030ED7747